MLTFNLILLKFLIWIKENDLEQSASILIIDSFFENFELFFIKKME
jgi:hypothetical protein